MYLQNGIISSDVGIVNLHPSKGTPWFININENYFDSFGCSPPQKLSKIIVKRNRHCLHSENKKQGLTDKKILIVQIFVYISFT